VSVGLLDVNVLLAAAWPKHIHHGVASKWLRQHAASGVATCTVTQLGFVRLSSNPRFSPDAVSPAEALALLRQITMNKWHHFWADPPDGLIHPAIAGTLGKSLTTHHVTDAYLAGLAKHHGGKLVTLDQPLVKLFPNEASLIT
jgi:uncharacterized protein